MRFDLVLIGFGHVARRFVSLLDARRGKLKREFGVTTRIVGVATRRHGQILDTNRSPLSLRSRGEAGRPLPEADTVAFIRRAIAAHRAAARQQRLVVVETTTLDIAAGQPAIDHVRTALAGGAHVVTANKGPAAFAYASLARAAARAKRRFLFEGAVMDGVPIFNLVRETLPAVRIQAFRGVVNSTTNFILTAMARGQSFDDALADMQRAGIAEADPSLDIDGWDAAAKTAALANVLLGARMTPLDVERLGIGPDIAAAVRAAERNGRRIKLVARAARDGAHVTARVAPEELTVDDPLAALDGQQNAIVFTTDLLGDIEIVQRSGSLTHTAYALLSDLLTIVRDVRR